MERDPLKCVCDILKIYMDLNSQQIWLFNQNFLIPNTSGLFIVVQDIGGKEIGIKSKMITDEFDNLIEEMSKQAQKIVQIDIYSKNNEAKIRQNEIILALNSTQSQQIQEKYLFKIANMEQTLTNTSYQEGGYMLNKFTFTLNLFYTTKKQKIVESFKTFNHTILIEK